MGYLHQALVCLFLMLPLANSELKSRRRDTTLISGKIMSLSGAGQYDLRDSIPGEPGVDYPIFSSPPETSFSCLNRHEGYYADVETRCQVFRICSHTDQTGRGFAFLCPNGTLFSQHDFVCDWYRNVACEASPNFYFMNELLDKAVSPHPELLMKDIVAMVNYPMKVMKQQKIFQNIERQQQPPSPPPPPTFLQTTSKPVINFSFQKTPITPPPFTQPVRNPFQTESRYDFGRVPPANRRPPQLPQFQRPLFRPTTQPEATAELERQPEPQQKPLFSSTSIPEQDNGDNTNNYDSGRVYISSLGELSTDPGSNFDPNTAVILPDKSQEQSPIFTQAGNQEHLLEGKLEPTQSDAHKNLLLNLENIASSIPGNINSQLALVPDQPQVQGSLVQLPGTLHVSLNYTQKINTALNNVLIPTAAQAQLAKNPILTADGKLVSEIYGQNQLQNNSGILKFAHNINSAFQVTNPLTEDAQPPGVFGQKLFNTNDLNNINGLSLQTGNFGNTGHGFEASGSQTPYGLDGRVSFQSIPTAPGSQAEQQFQYQQRQQGFNFNRNNAASSTPAPIIHRETIYIPSIGPKALGLPIVTNRGSAVFNRITTRGRHHQSTTHIIQKQTNPADVSLQRQTTSYINIPGTKIGIAKAIDEGHYSESTYPLRPNPMDQAKRIIFPNIIINPGTPFMARQRSFLMGPNLTLPSPNVSTAKPIIQTIGTISTTTPLAAFSFFNGISSTPIPSLTSIPLTAQPAERRADLADDEEAFFRGISSYSVPLNSVGRLPADIQGIQKR